MEETWQPCLTTVQYMCTKAVHASTDMECHTDTMYDRGQPTRLNYFDVNHNMGKASTHKMKYQKIILLPKVSPQVRECNSNKEKQQKTLFEHNQHVFPLDQKVQENPTQM